MDDVRQAGTETPPQTNSDSRRTEGNQPQPETVALSKNQNRQCEFGFNIVDNAVYGCK